MQKPLAETYDYDLETVEDVIKALMVMPKGYLLHPLGQKCKIGVDYVHGCVYLEDNNLIGEYVYSQIEEAKENGEPTEIEVPDKELATYKPELYLLLGYVGYAEKRFMGVFSTDKLAAIKGDRLVESGAVSYYEIKPSALDENLEG